MRPTLLDPFFAPVRSLGGVGVKLGSLLAKLLDRGDILGEPRLVDLVHFLPTSLIDRRYCPGIANAKAGEIVTLSLHIVRHLLPEKRSSPYRVIGHDETGEITLVFFRAQKTWLEQQLPIGVQIHVSGKIEWFHGQAQMVHPDYMVPITEEYTFPWLEPVYPLTFGLSSKTLSRIIKVALNLLPPLPEWQDETLILREHFPPYHDCLFQLHYAQVPDATLPTSAPRRRLAYDEFLAGQLALGLVRHKFRATSGLSRPANGYYMRHILAHMPFDLTAAQTQTWAEISQDLAAPQRMLRLLQGDVGSGKTILALLAAAQTIDSGGQAALMVPTEVLARQHLASLEVLTKNSGLQIACLSGREKGRARTEILQKIADGTTQLVIGTHALFQESVHYHNLGLAIIDEQHRFGVQQRLELAKKGASADMLVMTATPIPRSLVLAAFGDMDVSQIRKKPRGRKPVTTALVSFERMGEMLTRVQAALLRGDKIYWICPLVEESDMLDLTAAEKRFDSLQKHFGNSIGLVHGKMGAAEKDASMAAFIQGQTRLLVATTVIEVGVDVPDASIIIIEHAERFGLAQLHQLRGRVGRGDTASSCILLYKNPLTLTAKARLKIMREAQDGFRIAEEDLRLRGEGELLGIRQSGYPSFHLAMIEEHGDLLEMARQDAKLILSRDPDLATPRGQALRLLLYLFRRDDAIKLLRAG